MEIEDKIQSMEKLFKERKMVFKDDIDSEDEVSAKEREQLDLEIKKVIDEEKRIMEEIWAEKDSKVRIQMIKDNIADIISEFEKGEKNKNNLVLATRKIDVLDVYGGYGSENANEIQNAWGQEPDPPALPALYLSQNIH